MKNTILEHLKDLKKAVFRILIFFFTAFCLSYFYKEEIYALLLKPFIQNLSHLENRQIIYTNLSEAFVVYIQLSFFMALFLTVPFFLSQILYFISPGLLKKERKFAYICIFLIPMLLIVGVLFAYFYAFPVAWKFFLSFEQNNSKVLGIPLLLYVRMQDYLSLCVQIMIAFGLTFQLPAMIIILYKLKLISIKALRAQRRIVVVIAFGVAAIITPPDAMSQIILALIMILLYEISIYICLCIIPSSANNTSSMK